MNSIPKDEGGGFLILSDPQFERLTLEERVEYLKSAVAAVQRLQNQIHRIVDQVGKKPAP